MKSTWQGAYTYGKVLGFGVWRIHQQQHAERVLEAGSCRQQARRQARVQRVALQPECAAERALLRTARTEMAAQRRQALQAEGPERGAGCAP